MAQNLKWIPSQHFNHSKSFLHFRFWLDRQPLNLSILTTLSCCFTRGSTWTSTCLKIWRATQPTDSLLDIQGLNVCHCLGGEVMIWSIGSTRNRWLTRRGRQSVEHSGDWDCITDKPRKMKKTNSGWRVPVIMINFISHSSYCVEHFIRTYKAVKYADGSRLVNLGEACLRLEWHITGKTPNTKRNQM